jgi:hypothetical protein
MLLPVGVADQMLPDNRVKRGALPGGVPPIVFKERTEKIAQSLQPGIPGVAPHEGGQDFDNEAPISRMLEFKLAQHQFSGLVLFLKTSDEREKAFLVQKDVP